MIHIDGGIGEGGGQILRSALGLSMVTGHAFRIDNIRAGREKPGLLRQHLTAVNAAAAICSAEIAGAAISSGSLTFTPGKVKSGDYTFSIGSAGSTTLVLQTVLPALLVAGGPSTITLEGGTHNPHAPPFHFLERAFVPLLNRMGPIVELKLDRAGFYPAGGGRFTTNIQPASQLHQLQLLERGETKRKLATAIVAGLPGSIAKRELEKVKQKLGWSMEQLQIRQLPAAWGPGNALMLEVESDRVTEIFTGFGMKHITAEGVAHSVIEEVRRYLADDNPVGPFMADQLLIPIAMAGGGAFQTGSLTKHSTTNIEIIERFLPVRFALEKIRQHRHIVRVHEKLVTA